MLADMGSTLLFAAMMVSLLLIGSGCLRKTTFYWQIVPALAITGSLITSVAFAVLIAAFVMSDFSVSTVYLHSHTLQPLLYKTTASWGNHEGSMLLWCWVLSIYTMILAVRARAIPLPVKVHALHILGGIQTAFIAYTLMTSNPFSYLFPTPVEGQGFNPLLQDVGLAIHPPMLYLGYVGFAAVFALSLACVVTQHQDKALSSALHPWIMWPWAFLTLGIGLGSWWAYRELGWGGWWFWDPVENASLLPWLTATALFHSNVVMRKRGALHRWVLLLAVVTFLLSLLGTFLVRSGVLTSVHSFASDPERGVMLLAIIGVITAYALYVYYRYYTSLPRVTGAMQLWSKETLILCNNLLLLAMMVAILLAMLYPMLVEAVTGTLLSIGESYYNHVMIALSVPLLLLCALSTIVLWNGTRFPHWRTFWPFIVSGVIGIAAMCWYTLSLPACAGLVAGLWVILANIAKMVNNIRLRIPASQWAAMVLGHLALGTFTIAVTLYGSFHQYSDFVMKPGESQKFAGYDLHLKDMVYGNGTNYVTQTGEVDIQQDNEPVVTLHPEERYYPIEEQFSAETAIKSSVTHDLYATLKRAPEILQQDKAEFILQFHVNPAISWIWAGFLLAGISGVIAAMTRHTGKRR